MRVLSFNTFRGQTKMNSNLMRVLMITTALLFSVGANISTVHAADEKPALTSATDKQSLESLKQELANIEQQRQAIKDLQARIAKSDGLTKKTLEAHLDKAWLELLDVTRDISFQYQE